MARIDKVITVVATLHEVATVHEQRLNELARQSRIWSWIRIFIGALVGIGVGKLL